MTKANRTIMSTEDILKALFAATPEMKAKISQVLRGEDNPSQTDKDEETRLVSISGAARLLSVSRFTIYSLLRQNRLDAVQLSGANKITMRSINEFLRGMRPANSLTQEAITESKARYAATKNGGASNVR